MKILGARRAKSNPRRYPHTYIQKLASAYRSVHRVRSTTGALHLFFSLSLSNLFSPLYASLAAFDRARVQPGTRSPRACARVYIYLGARARISPCGVCVFPFSSFLKDGPSANHCLGLSVCVCVCNGARARAFVYSLDGFEGERERERESWRRFSGV